MGRPTIYTRKLANKICQEIMEGKSMRQICAPADMPNKSTVYRWLARSAIASRIIQSLSPEEKKYLESLRSQ